MNSGLRVALISSLVLLLAACGPPKWPQPPTTKAESSLGSTPTRDGRLGTPCGDDAVIGDDHKTLVWRPVCTIPYVRLVADADRYDGQLVALQGYLFRSGGLRFVPSPEYVRRGMQGEEMDLRGGTADDKLMTEMRDRPEWDLCGPVRVKGRFDRTWTGIENHGRVLGQLWLMFPIHTAGGQLHQLDEDVDDEPYRCVSLLRRSPKPNRAGAAPAPARGG